MVLGFFKEAFFFGLAARSVHRGSLNGDVVVFDSIENLMSFSSVWYVCVATGCRMIV
jgi:hypothetical protein